MHKHWSMHAGHIKYSKRKLKLDCIMHKKTPYEQPYDTLWRHLMNNIYKRPSFGVKNDQKFLRFH